MKLPKEINYAEMYLTFRCNFACNYCINKISGLEKRTELSGEEWIKGLDQIDFGDLQLTIGGGEPTLHKDFFQIINNLKPKVELLTNMNFDVDRFIENANPERFNTSKTPFYHSIRASYHVGNSVPEELVKRVKRLNEHKFNAAIFGVRHPYTINENMQMAWLCAKNGIPFYEKDFLGKVNDKFYGFYKYPEGLNGKKKEADCRVRELLIAPDGDIFKCHRDLYHSENSDNNLKELKPITYDFRKCNNFGECNPCDLKLKTNKYLGGIDCQTEIK